MIGLEQSIKAHLGVLESLPFGTCAVTTTVEPEIHGALSFVLRPEGEGAQRIAEAGFPLRVGYLVHVGADGTVLPSFTQAKQILDRLKLLCLWRDLPDASACACLDKATKQGGDLHSDRCLLVFVVASAVGKNEERAVSGVRQGAGTGAGRQ